MSSELIVDDSGQIKEQRYRAALNAPGEASRAKTIGASFTSADLPEATGRGKITLRPLTKYEQSIMARIPQRHHDNLVQKQIVGGKEYKGSGFLPQPTAVNFLHFSVGETYKADVVLTNVSQTFNSYKVLEVPRNVRDVFDVVYTPPSMLSAGMTGKITIIFSPKENIDLDIDIPMLAQTGPFRIPVKCRRKRVVISVSSKFIDFGTVVVAEESVRSITLANSGALPVKVSASGEIIEALQLTQSSSNVGKSRKILTSTPEKLTDMTINAFSSSTVSFRFAPLEQCNISSTMFLSFDSTDVEDIVVLVRGNGIDVPVFVEHDAVLDFKCCYYSTLYREKFSVRNTTKSAVRVQPEIPPKLQNAIEYVPKFGFVQPNASFEFQVKFFPNESLKSEVDLAVRVNVHDQAMPIFYYIRASLSQRSIELSPPSLQFGVCSINEALSQPLKIQNVCRLSRSVGFTRLPANVSIFPKSIVRLAPDEAETLQVSIRPLALGAFTQTLTLLTECNETYTLTVSGHGKPAALALAPSNVQLPVCALNDSTSMTVLLTNNTSTLQRFCFDVHDQYCLTVSPAKGELGPNEAIPLVVTFTPTAQSVLPVELSRDPEEEAASAEAARPASREKEAKDPKAKKKSKAEEDAERKEKERLDAERKARAEKLEAEREQLRQELAMIVPWEESPENEVWSRHRTVLFPCYVEGWNCKAVFLEVSCTVVLPQIVATILQSGTAPMDSGRSSDAQKRSTQIAVDFGEVPALQDVERTISLRNTGQESVHLFVKPLDPFGPFKLIRPPITPLAADHECEIVVQFAPTCQAMYSQPLVVCCPNANNTIIPMVGEGLPATLAISLDKANSDTAKNEELAVALGHCLSGERVDIPVYFTNFSPFPLTVVISFLPDTVSCWNANSTNAFSMTPNKFTLPPQGKLEVAASFSPTVESSFEATASVEFGGKGTAKKIHFSGCGWEKGLFAFFPLAPVRRDTFGCFGDLTQRPGSASAAPLMFELVVGEGRTATHTIVVGNNKGSSNGEFTVEGLGDQDTKSGWKVDPIKASLVPGGKQKLQVSFTPSQALVDSLPMGNIDVVSVLHIRIVLRGGTPVNDATFFVQLKGVLSRSAARVPQ